MNDQKTGGFVNKEHEDNCHTGASDYMTDLWKDPEYQKKMGELASEQMKKKHAEGKIRYATFTGKKHSDKTKVLMSEKKIGTGLGKENSQFGTCWITKDGENKKINKDLLNEFINEGWKKGRKMN